MDDLGIQSSMIKAEAIRLGFDGCGISHAEKLDEDARYLNDWLQNNYHGKQNFHLHFMWIHG
jgi:epoxyqueuosine reductase